MKPITQRAYQLLHEGSLVFAEMERNGIHVDLEYCQSIQKHLTRQIDRLTKDLETSKIAEIGRSVYGKTPNFESDEQLAHILFEKMGIEPIRKTASGKPSVDAASLEALNIPELTGLLRKRKLIKARDTYIHNFILESAYGYLHPFFHLHTVMTYRSSSSAPNFQNIPNRDPEIKALCRKAIIPRPGNKLCCIDFSGVEVRIAACYHKDPTMIAYIEDPSSDMHRDMAASIYLLNHDQVTKPIRHSGKNEFVFPEFYGDWYKSCAANLFTSAHNDTHVLANGLRLTEHLTNRGIGTLPLFEDHLKKVEDHFWNVRFPVYTQWKEDWWKAYQRMGYFETLTGFVCQGVMRRNEAINYPVQGSAFHCTLFSLIEISRLLKKYNFKSKIVGQIHDEAVIDLYPPEEALILPMIKEIMTKQIRLAWRWINVPIDVEISLTPIDGSWVLKKEVKI